MTATFENGLVPSIRLESIREDPPNTFQEHAFAPRNMRQIISEAYPQPHPLPYLLSRIQKNPQLQNSVSSNTAIIKDLKEEIAKLKSAVNQPCLLYTSPSPRD